MPPTHPQGARGDAPGPAVANTASNMVDPTTLTTQMTQREILGVREIFEARQASLESALELQVEVLETRLNGMDTAIELVRIAETHMVVSTDEKIKGLRAVSEEKFANIQTQFKERDVAVTAALQAAEKAVGKQQEAFGAATDKSEAATTKQIAQISDLLAQGIRMLDDKIADIKERLTRAEGANPGIFASITSAGACLLSLASIVIALVVAMRH